jgi:TolA-binding protein
MIDVVNARIKAFGTSPKADFVSPSEQLITLTIGQLQELVTQAIEKAIQPLQERIEFMEDTIAALDTKVSVLESTQETQADNQHIQLRLIGQLREANKKDAQPLQKDRGDILRALLVANGDKMLAKDARQKMRMDKATFSRLLDTLKDHIDIKPFHTDRRRLILIIK